MRPISLPNLAGKSVAALLAQAETQLVANTDDPRREAELLLTHALAWPRGRLWAFPEAIVASEIGQRFLDLVERRRIGEPAAYLTGRAGFWTLELEVSPDTLIPRPETELLVETALKLADSAPRHVVDLGTGSGAIALALASERLLWHVFATDLHAGALSVARRNARRLNLSNVSFMQGSWCRPLASASFDLIVANPPYIAAGDPHLPALRYEPSTALIADSAGLANLKMLAATAHDCLTPGGWLLMEHGYNQGAASQELLQLAGYQAIATLTDLAGHPRVTLGQRRPNQ